VRSHHLLNCQSLGSDSKGNSTFSLPNQLCCQYTFNRSIIEWSISCLEVIFVPKNRSWVPLWLQQSKLSTVKVPTIEVEHRWGSNKWNWIPLRFQQTKLSTIMVSTTEIEYRYCSNRSWKPLRFHKLFQQPKLSTIKVSTNKVEYH
jgi:hypothetical protein